jgi:hypothetical protein
MNLGMSNTEFMQFLTRFVRETKPETVEFVPGQIVLFRIKMNKADDGDVLEFVINVDITRKQLFKASWLPDQVCYLPCEKKLFANEYTLSALNYGYCELDVEKRPKAMRLSTKLNKLGFNFYFKQPFVNNNMLLKERLERYVWSISQPENGCGRASYATTRKPSDKQVEPMSCVAKKDKVFASGKLIFTSENEFMEYMRTEAEKVDEKGHSSGIKIIELDGAIILPENKKIDSAQLVMGLDWSF